MKMNSSESAHEDWLKESKSGPTKYHTAQYAKPYRSTVAFHNWLKDKDLFRTGAKIADIPSGMGAPLSYFATMEPQCDFTGLDFDPVLVRESADHFAGISNACIEQGDMYDLSQYACRSFDGVMSLATLSWEGNGFQPLLESFVKINPGWIAVSSLFYDGPVNATIHIQDYSKPVEGKPYKDAFYNCYSLSLVEQFLVDLGYSLESIPFEIDCDLEPPADKGMATFTEMLKDGRRIQISGPLLMNWHFLLARRMK